MCSMATEVNNPSVRSRSIHICGTPLCWGTRKESQLQQKGLREGSQRDIHQDGWHPDIRGWQKGNRSHPEINERKRQWTQVRIGVSRRVHCQCCPDYPRVDLLCQCWRLKSCRHDWRQNHFWTQQRPQALKPHWVGPNHEGGRNC